MDVDRLLNIEKRTGIKDADIDKFVDKASAVEAAIKGMIDGTVDPNKIKIKGHINYQLCAKVDKLFEKLLDNKTINLYNRKRVMDICRDWYNINQSKASLESFL